MSNPAVETSRRLLDPVARTSEVLFGLIMVLTFTGSFSVASASREDTRELLIGALGCNLAWGVVDAVMYLMSNLTERARGRRTLNAVRQASEPHAAHALIADALPPIIASTLDEAHLEMVRQRLGEMPDPADVRLLTGRHWLEALGVFLLVFLSTFPVVVPFLFIEDARLALRISNAVAIGMLFCCGVSLGRFAGRSPWLVGLSMVIVGLVLAAMTLALGG